MGFRKLLNNFFARISTFAGRVAESATAGSILNIEDQVVAGARRNSQWHGIQA